MNKLDRRLVKIGIEIDGVTREYTNLAITGVGTKYANPLQNESEITIDNLDKNTQDYILTETSPYTLNKTQKIVTLYAGRESYGYTKIYSGNIITANISQPPDLRITLKCLTGNFYKGQIIGINQPGQASLSQISKQIAQDLNVPLLFQAKDKNIANYTYSGSSLNQIDYLANTGNINVFLDDGILVVKDAAVPLTGSLRELNAQNGMIGIPEFTEQGIRVTFLIDNITRLGGGLRLVSQIYPAINGDYYIYKLGFNIANRDNPFYYIAEGARLPA